VKKPAITITSHNVPQPLAAVELLAHVLAQQLRDQNATATVIAFKKPEAQGGDSIFSTQHFNEEKS
jgi:hypothetical protein